MTGSGVHPHSVVHEARLALRDAARVALEGEAVDIAFGFRWPVTEHDWFAVVDADSDIDPASVLPRRALDERMTLSVSVGSWVPGVDEESEIESSARAFDLLRRVQEHIRVHDITLDGTVLWCLPGGLQTAGATESFDASEGRLTEIAATFVCAHRIA